MSRTLYSVPCTLLVTALSLPAQWTEVGDAGNLPLTAQVPPFTIIALPSITGTITGNGDVDMYLIEIADVSTFSATTVGGTTVDTQLWLFYPDGRGVTHQDGFNGATGLQSTITNAFVKYPGSYLLAVSAYDVDPLASGQLIFNDQPFNTEHPADGPRRDEPVDAWSTSGFFNGPYTIALTGCTRTGGEFVLPDNHHLSESTTQLGTVGTGTFWRNTAGRFQVLYESTHFTNNGVTGSIFLDKMMFRGEDGEPNTGGHSWANVAITFATTSLTSATLGANFATNLVGATNVQSITVANVTESRSIGATPNNYNIQIDLLNSPIVGYFYNPTQGNLLIDVTMPTAPTAPASAGPMMAMQDTTGVAAFVRGAGVTTATPASTTGALTGFPPIVAFRVDGPLGARPMVPARNEFYGAACGGSASTFYQAFLTGQNFDLVGLTLTPDNAAAPNFYTVTQGAAPFDATQVNAVPAFTGDGGAVSHPLGFTFAYPGATTTSIRPTSDGFVWLNNATGGGDFTVTVSEFLSTTARLAPCWYDFDAGRNTAANPLAGGHVLTTGVAPNRIAYVTWLNIGAFDTVSGTGISGHAVYDLQMAIFETTNVVEFRYGEMPDYVSNNEPTPDPNYPAIVGFSRGMIGALPSVNPQSRDLSVEVPFSTSVEGATGNMVQRVVATPDAGGIAYNGRAFAGQTLTFDAVNIPTAFIGVQLIDVVASRPGLSIPGIHATGCIQSVSLNAVIHQVALLPGSTFVGTVPFVVPPGFDGVDLYAQFAILDGLFGGPALITQLSNAVRLRLGKD